MGYMSGVLLHLLDGLNNDATYLISPLYIRNGKWCDFTVAPLLVVILYKAI